MARAESSELGYQPVNIACVDYAKCTGSGALCIGGRGAICKLVFRHK